MGVDAVQVPPGGIGGAGITVTALPSAKNSPAQAVHITLTSRSVVPRATNVESRNGLLPDVCTIPVQTNDTNPPVPPLAAASSRT